MSYKIQSEYQYYLEVTQELEEKLLSRVHEFISAHFSSSSSSKGGINNLPSNENEALAKLFEKCHQLSSRVSRAISRTEEEVLEEWNAIHHLLEGDGSSFSSPVQVASSPTTAPPPPYVPSTKNKKVAEKGLSELPEKLIDLAELKYQLLQCETALKHSSSAPTSSATIVKSTVSSGKEYFEEHFPEFLGQCATAVGAGLTEAMLNGNDQTSSLEKFKSEASAVDVTSDVKMTVFHSLLGETLKNFLTKLDQRRRVLRRASSSSSLLNSTNTSVHSSPTTVPSATINNTSSSSTKTQQQQKPNFSHSTPTTVHQQPENQSAKNQNQNQNQQNQHQNQNQQHHLYSSAFLPPYHPSMSEDQVKDILTNFYTVHAPDFLASVPYLVHEHRDNLGALFEMVAAKYSSNTSENNNNQQQQMGLRQVSSQPQLSREEVEMAKPSAEADRTLDDDEEEYNQRTQNQNTSSSSSPSKVEVVAVRVDERSHQRVQSPLNNNQQQQQQQQQQQSAYAGASAADSNEGNCALQ